MLSFVVSWWIIETEDYLLYVLQCTKKKNWILNYKLQFNINFTLIRLLTNADCECKVVSLLNQLRQQIKNLSKFLESENKVSDAFSNICCHRVAVVNRATVDRLVKLRKNSCYTANSVWRASTRLSAVDWKFAQAQTWNYSYDDKSRLSRARRPHLRKYYWNRFELRLSSRYPRWTEKYRPGRIRHDQDCVQRDEKNLWGWAEVTESERVTSKFGEIFRSRYHRLVWQLVAYEHFCASFQCSTCCYHTWWSFSKCSRGIWQLESSRRLSKCVSSIHRKFELVPTSFECIVDNLVPVSVIFACKNDFFESQTVSWLSNLFSDHSISSFFRLDDLNQRYIKLDYSDFGKLHESNFDFAGLSIFSSLRAHKENEIIPRAPLDGIICLNKIERTFYIFHLSSSYLYFN